MEVFISEKDENFNIIENFSEINELDVIFSSQYCPIYRDMCSKVKSLDQHDLEIRADERKKVVEELLEFIKEKEHFEGLKGYWGGNVLDLTLLKQKLTELKGEKDE